LFGSTTAGIRFGLMVQEYPALREFMGGDKHASARVSTAVSNVVNGNVAQFRTAMLNALRKVAKGQMPPDGFKLEMFAILER